MSPDDRRLRAVNLPTLTGGKQVGPSELGHSGVIPGYRESNFYVAGSDDKGRSATLRVAPGDTGRTTVPFPRYIVAQVNELIEAEHTPYRYQQDFIRDSVVHRLHYLQQFRKDDEIWGTFVDLSEIKRAKEEAKALSALVYEVDEGLDTASHSGDRELYNTIHARGEKLLVALREPYRTELERTLAKYQQPR